MSNELKPCPFCGGEVMAEILDDGERMWWQITHCGADEFCFAMMKSDSWWLRSGKQHLSKKLALIKRWNHRAGDTDA